MSQLPERYRAAIAPLIGKARELLEQGEALAPIDRDNRPVNLSAVP